jgi:hypothetical protein
MLCFISNSKFVAEEEEGKLYEPKHFVVLGVKPLKPLLIVNIRPLE